MTNTSYFWGSKTTAAQFVSEMLQNLEPGCVLTMTITPELLGGYSVNTATDASSEDFDYLKERTSYWQRTRTSQENTPAG